MAPWLIRPATVSRARREPFWLVQIIPSWGSQMTAAVTASAWPRSMKCRTPSIWSSSSHRTPPTMVPESRTPLRLRAAMAASMAARLPLVSLVPRPYMRRPTIAAPKGSWVQVDTSPGVTTSVWPSNMRVREPLPAACVTITLGRPGATVLHRDRKALRLGPGRRVLGRRLLARPGLRVPDGIYFNKLGRQVDDFFGIHGLQYFFYYVMAYHFHCGLTASYLILTIFGSSVSRRPSPNRLNPSTAQAIATPGKIAIQGAVDM